MNPPDHAILPLCLLEGAGWYSLAILLTQLVSQGTPNILLATWVGMFGLYKLGYWLT